MKQSTGLKSAYDYGYAYAEWFLDGGEFLKTGKSLEECRVEIGQRNSVIAPEIPECDYDDMMRNNIPDNGTSYDYWEGYNDCIQERLDATPITVEEVTSAIENGTIEWDGDATADNYGTDGMIRYQQDATLRGKSICVYWDTTEEYNQWDEACKLCNSVASSAHGVNRLSDSVVSRILDIGEEDDISDEIIDEVSDYLDCDTDDAHNIIAAYIRYGGHPEEYADCANDDSCDWDNPVAVREID